MIKRLLFVAYSIPILVSCGVPEGKYNSIKQTCDSLQQVVSSLKTEIDELKNGEERLVSLAKNSYTEGKYSLASNYIDELRNKHPESKELAYFRQLESELKLKIEEEKVIIEKQKRDSIKLANINNLGVWETGFYVDKFNEPTKEGYVYTELSGRFSNSATTDSKLTVKFLIDQKSIRIQLYEYAGNHPIKGEGFVKFIIKDSNNKEHQIYAYNNDTGDTSVESKNIITLRKILLGGGEIKFFATAGEYTKSEYKFTIRNADFLENAFTKIELQNK